MAYRFTIFLVSALAWGAVDVPLTLTDASGTTRTADHATFGVPLPSSENVTDAANLMVTTDGGSVIDSQRTVLARWGGAPSDATKPIKWVLLDFKANVASNSTAVYRLKDRVGADPGTVSPLTVTDGASTVTVDTGAITFVVRKDYFNFFDSVSIGATPVVTSGTTNQDFRVVAGGTVYSSANAGSGHAVTIESNGPFRAQIRAKGQFVDGGSGNKKCLYDVRFVATAGSSAVKVYATWILDQDAYVFKPSEITLGSPLQLNTNNLVFTSGATSFGIEAADYAALVQEDHNAFTVLKNGASQATGTKASWADISDGSVGVSVAIRDLAQNHPLEIEASGASIRTHLWPVHADLVTLVNAKRAAAANNTSWFPYQPTNELDLRAAYKGNDGLIYAQPTAGAVNPNAAGMAKTWEMLYYFHSGAAVAADSAGVVARFQDFLAGVNPEWYAASGALGPIRHLDTVNFSAEETKSEAVFDTLVATQVTRAEYGMTVYGDQRYMASDNTARTWMHNRYGWWRTPLVEYLRTGKRKYLTFGLPAILHATDVDRHHVRLNFLDANGNRVDKYSGSCGNTGEVGFAHWSQYSNGSTYTSNGEPNMDCRVGGAMLAYYYLGYQRGLDTSAERADRVVASTNFGSTQWSTPANRDSGGGMEVMAEMVAHDPTNVGWSSTADAIYDHIQQYQQTVIGIPNNSTSPLWVTFDVAWMTDSFSDYARLKNSPAITSEVSRLLRAAGGMGKVSSPVSSGPRAFYEYMSFSALAQCWDLTADANCQSYLKRQVELMLPTATTGVSAMPGWRWLAWTPMATKALLGYTYVEPHWPISYVQLQQNTAVVLKARETVDAEWSVTLQFECGTAVFQSWPACGNITLTVKKPDGSVIAGYPQTFTPPHTVDTIIAGGADGRYYTFTVPVDTTTGDYTIEVTSDRADSTDQTIMGIAGSTLGKVWAALGTGGLKLDVGSRWFYVPDTVTSFSMSCPSYTCYVTRADGTTTTIYGTAQTITPTAAQKGGMWKANLGYPATEGTVETVFDLNLVSGSGFSREISFSQYAHPDGPEYPTGGGDSEQPPHRMGGSARIGGAVVIR